MMKIRKKSGLRSAQRMYQGKAVAQKEAMATGCSSRKASRHFLVKTAQKKTAPPHKMIAAGPLASTASPRKNPKSKSAAQGVCGRIGVFSFRVKPSATAAKTIAMVSIALKGMSVAAACEKPIMPTLVGSTSKSQRAVSAPKARQASQARASVANKAQTAL